MAPAPSIPAAKAGNKRRAPMSCDRCKSRKTKCVDPVPGPCQFCASIGAACHLDPSRRRQRPYYHVSEEEFRYMTKALEHFLPNTELNLQSLREVIQSFEAQSSQPATGPVGRLHSSPSESAASSSTSSLSSTADSVIVSDGDSHNQTTPVSSVSSESSTKSDETAVTIDEIDELHGELGWLRVDSKGTFRHVGADSGYGFHAAVRSLGQRRGSEVSKTDIVPPFTAAPPLPPPSTPDSSSIAGSGVGVSGAGGVGPGGAGGVGMGISMGGVGGGMASPRQHATGVLHGLGSRRVQIFLPRRDLCNRCVSRFFRDIQSVYWFWSAERFYAILDRLYAGDQSSATPAMLCSLYSILALTCESEAQQAALAGDPAAAGPPPPAARYLSLAKTLVPALCDEADTDSVRALCLLGLALQSAMFSNTAYIYVGAAARIALTLGLHLQRAIEPRGCLQRQVDLRLYSTLFLLDMDVALCYGNPPAISDEQAAGKLQDLAEQILGPGSHMPLDYLSVSCELVQIKRRLSKLLYARTGSSAASASTSGATSSPSQSSQSLASSPKPSLAAVRAVLADLRAWYAAIPPHLRDVTRAASFHQRSVSVLHLRYWSATIFATRPFLLYSALHADALATLPPTKRASFEAFCTTCLDAAAQSLAVISFMRDSDPGHGQAQASCHAAQVPSLGTSTGAGSGASTDTGGLLSSLITLDTTCILENLQVFLLGLSRRNDGATVVPDVSAISAMSGITSAAIPGGDMADNVRACLRILQGMEPIFWTHHALTEVMAQLDENGLLNGDNNFSPQGDTPSHFFLDIQQQQQQENLIAGVMESYFSELHDPFFAVGDDTSMLGDHFQDSIAGALAL